MTKEQKQMLKGLKKINLQKAREQDEIYNVALEVVGLKEDQSGWLSDFLFEEKLTIKDLEGKLIL